MRLPAQGGMSACAWHVRHRLPQATPSPPCSSIQCLITPAQICAVRLRGGPPPPLAPDPRLVHPPQEGVGLQGEERSVLSRGGLNAALPGREPGRSRFQPAGLHRCAAAEAQHPAHCQPGRPLLPSSVQDDFCFRPDPVYDFTPEYGWEVRTVAFIASFHPAAAVARVQCRWPAATAWQGGKHAVGALPSCPARPAASCLCTASLLLSCAATRSPPLTGRVD